MGKDLRGLRWRQTMLHVALLSPWKTLNLLLRIVDRGRVEALLVSLAAIRTLLPAVGGRDVVCGEEGGQDSRRN